MGTGRWRIQLVEEEDEPGLPMLWRPRPDPDEAAGPGAAPDRSASLALLAAVRRLGRRSEGPQAWTAPLSEDPIAFLLDAMGDAVNLWGPSGQLIYRNRAAAELQLDWPAAVGSAALGPAPPLARVQRLTIGERRFERRCLSFLPREMPYLLDVVTEVR
jgi:hypothetical protein